VRAGKTRNKYGKLIRQGNILYKNAQNPPSIWRSTSIKASPTPANTFAIHRRSLDKGSINPDQSAQSDQAQRGTGRILVKGLILGPKVSLCRP